MRDGTAIITKSGFLPAAFVLGLHINQVLVTVGTARHVGLSGYVRGSNGE